jgi:hypothetical protein
MVPMDDAALREWMAELVFEAAEKVAARLGPARSELFWEHVEAVAKGEIDTEEFGTLLDRLQGCSSGRSIN